MTLESLGVYETAEVIAAVTLSSKLFHKLNNELSVELEQIKADFGI